METTAFSLGVLSHLCPTGWGLPVEDDESGSDNSNLWHLLSTWPVYLLPQAPYFGYRPAHLSEAQPLHVNSDRNRATDR